MDISTNEQTEVRALQAAVRLGALVHALADGQYHTRCGIDSDATAPILLVHGEADEAVDCMTCLVDRRVRIPFDQVARLSFSSDKPFPRLP